MDGELILSSNTIDEGRILINNQFSGTAEFNNIILDSGANLSGGTGGGIFYSGGTNLYDIFLSTADRNDITRIQSGTNTITGGTPNTPSISIVASPIFNSITSSGASSFNVISASTIYSGNTNLSDIISSFSGDSNTIWSSSTGFNSIISNNGTGNLASGENSISIGYANQVSGAYSSILGGSGNTIDSLNYSTIIGGVNNAFNFIVGPPITHYSSAIIAGSGNSMEGGVNSVIIGGQNMLLGGYNNVVLGGNGFSPTIAENETAYMQRAYVDEYIDLNPQSTTPFPSIGRIFFSGFPLFKLMVNTGGTPTTWAIV